MLICLQDPSTCDQTMKNIFPGCNYAVPLKLFLEELVAHEELRKIWNEAHSLGFQRIQS